MHTQESTWKAKGQSAFRLGNSTVLLSNGESNKQRRRIYLLFAATLVIRVYGVTFHFVSNSLDCFRCFRAVYLPVKQQEHFVDSPTVN